MTCPPEIASLLLEILKTGILRIRSAAWSGDAGRCAIEADHIHNLADLLLNYSPELLNFYWEIGRPSFIDQSPAAELVSFQPLWAKLADHSRPATEKVLTP